MTTFVVDGIVDFVDGDVGAIGNNRCAGFGKQFEIGAPLFAGDFG